VSCYARVLSRYPGRGTVRPMVPPPGQPACRPRAVLVATGDHSGQAALLFVGVIGALLMGAVVR